MVQGQERLVAVPEAQRLEPGVDGPLGRLASLMARRGGHAIVHDLPVREYIATVRGHLLHLRLADADMGHAQGPLLPACAQCPDDALDDQLVELQVADGTRRPVRLEQPLGRQVGDGRVVLVDRGDQDVLRVGLDEAGEGLSPAVVGIVADLAPIDREQDDGAGQRAPLEHEADRLEPIVDRPHRRDPAPHTGMAERGRHVGGEGCEKVRAEEPVGRANVRAALRDHSCRQAAQGVATCQLRLS